MITERDKKAIEFLEQFKMATPMQIDKIAYNNPKVAYKRLNRLYNDNLIYRATNTLNKGYIYATSRIRSVKQFQHASIRNEFYIKLRGVAEVDTVVVEKICGSIRPDLLVTGTYKGQFFFFSVEVETNGNHSSVNYQKYRNFFLVEWKEYFTEKPTVLYITDKAIHDESINFPYKHLNTRLDNFTDIFI